MSAKIIGPPMMGELPTQEEAEAQAQRVITMCPTDSMPSSAAEYIEQVREMRASGKKLVTASQAARDLAPKIHSSIMDVLETAGEEKGIMGRVANFVREQVAGPKCPLTAEDVKKFDEFYEEFKNCVSRRVVRLPQHKAQVAEAMMLYAADLLQRYDPIVIEPELATLISWGMDLMGPMQAWAINNGYVEERRSWERMGKPNLGLAVAPGTPTRAGAMGKVHEAEFNAAGQVVGYKETGQDGQGAFMAPTISILGPKTAKVTHPGDAAAVPIRTATGTPVAPEMIVATPPTTIPSAAPEIKP